MSGPKAGNLSYELSALTSSYSAIDSSIDTLSSMRKQYADNLRIAELKSEISGKLLMLDEMNKSLRSLGDDTPFTEVLQVPEFTQMEELDEFESGLEELNTQISRYRKHISDYFQEKVVREKAGLKELKEMAAQNGSSPLFTVGGFIPSIENSEIMNRDALEKQLIKRCAENVKGMLSEFEKDFPDEPLPDQVVTLTSELFSAETQPEARTKQDQISAALRNHKVELEKKAEERKRKQAQSEKERISGMIGAVVAAAFEERGYEVSGIEETCFVKDGEIYAEHHKFEDHAIRFKLDKANNQSFTFTPVKMDESGNYREVKKGSKFDRFWCSLEQLGKFKEALAKRNLNILGKFKTTSTTATTSKAPESMKDRENYLKNLNQVLDESRAPKERQR